MITVKRTNAPIVFEKKRKKILNEIKRVKDFFLNTPKAKKPKNLFSFYSTEKDFYKTELIDMFRQRCAYCESIVTIGSRGDIEHFRPKGEFVTKEGKTIEPGYYWLAADWDNLYLSCINCNQNTTFKIIDSKDPTKFIEKPSGKMNQFALRDENGRLKNQDQKIHDEEPYRLLIDPCRDKPETMLEFTKDGIVRAKAENGIENDMALYSIDVYALQRERLVGIRKKKYLEIMDKIVTINRFRDLVVDGIKQQSKTQQHIINREEMEKSFLKLLSMLDPDDIYSEYIGACRQFAEPFLKEYSSFLTSILDPALNPNQPWYQDALDYFQPQLAALKLHFEKL